MYIFFYYTFNSLEMLYKRKNSIYFFLEMGARAAANSLAKRTTFSSAVNILSSDVATLDPSAINNRLHQDEQNIAAQVTVVYGMIPCMNAMQ